MTEKSKFQSFYTPPFIVAFEPNLFVPQQIMDSKVPKYSVCAVWTPDKFTAQDQQLWDELNEACNQKALEDLKKPIDDFPSTWRKPFRNWSEEKPEMYDFGPEAEFANLSTKMQPGVIDINDAEISPDLGNAKEIKAGIIARAKVTVYSYDNRGKGISVGLLNFQKLAEGIKLSPKTSAKEDFSKDKAPEIDNSWLESSEPNGDEEDDMMK